MITQKIFRVLNRIEEYFLCLMVLQMGLSIFLQVVLRYTFHAAITWLDELVHIEVILLTFFGAGLGVKYGFHISEPFRNTKSSGHRGICCAGRLFRYRSD